MTAIVPADRGFGLWHTQVTTTARPDRRILTLALALILLIGRGLVARRRFAPRDWGGSNDPHECSDVTVGCRRWGRIDAPPDDPIRAAVTATRTSAGNRG